jgi:hypothetical protein
MPTKRHFNKARVALRPETVAFIQEDRTSPDYPTGFSLFWHNFSLWSGHRHATWGYSVEGACEALGIDVGAVRKRYGTTTRYRGEVGGRHV